MAARIVAYRHENGLAAGSAGTRRGSDVLRVGARPAHLACRRPDPGRPRRPGAQPAARDRPRAREGAHRRTHARLPRRARSQRARAEPRSRRRRNRSLFSHGTGNHGTRNASHLPRRRSRGREDVRDARRGSQARRTRHGRRRRLHRDARPPEDGRAARRSRGDAAGAHRLPGHDLRGDGRRRDHRPPARGRARRRARPHERAGLAPREALGGRREPPRRRDHRDLDAQHPASRVGQRRRRADHRDQAAGDDSRRGGAARGPGRARRHGSRGDPPPDGTRQHLSRRAGRRRARELLPHRESGRAAGSSRCSGSRTASTTRSSTTGSGTASTGPGRRGSASSSR